MAHCDTMCLDMRLALLAVAWFLALVATVLGLVGLGVAVWNLVYGKIRPWSWWRFMIMNDTSLYLALLLPVGILSLVFLSSLVPRSHAK
jgi:hypothetical protein